MDRLQTVLHVLGNIIVTVSAVNSEVQRRETLWQPAAERAMFAKAVGAVIRDIEFEQNQVRLIITRLETVLEMVSPTARGRQERLRVSRGGPRIS